MNIIAFQPKFRPALPCVFASKDYREFRAALVEMDRILDAAGIEERFITARIAAYEKPLKPGQLQRHCKTLCLALRHNILLAITGLSYRELARHLADNHLFQWFTRTGFVDAVRPVSKSALERFEKLFDADAVAGLGDHSSMAKTEIRRYFPDLECNNDPKNYYDLYQPFGEGGISGVLPDPSTVPAGLSSC